MNPYFARYRRRLRLACALLLLLLTAAGALSEDSAPERYRPGLPRGAETALELTECQAVYTTASASARGRTVRRAYALCRDAGGEPVVVMLSEEAEDAGDADADAQFDARVEALLSPLASGGTLALEGYVEKVSLQGQSMGTGALMRLIESGVDPDAAQAQLLEDKRTLEAMVAEHTVVACALDGSPLRAPAASAGPDLFGICVTVALVVFALIVPVLLRRVSRPQPFEAPRPAPEAAASPLPPRLRVRKDESENNAP